MTRLDSSGSGETTLFPAIREKKEGREEVVLAGPGGFLEKTGNPRVRDGPFTDPWDPVLGRFEDFQGFQGCTSKLLLRETQSDWWRL